MLLTAERKCSLDGCDRRHKAHGLCSPHYLRQKRGVSLLAPGRLASSPADSVWRRVVPGFGGCQIFTGNLTPDGYGRVIHKRTWLRAHRVAWEDRVGPIPEGYVLDHRPTCPKRCVNVDHMQQLTIAEHLKVTQERPEEWGDRYLNGRTRR